MSKKYAAATVECDRFTVRMKCGAPGVRVGGFFDAKSRTPQARLAWDERRRVEVRAMFTRCRIRCGAPRVRPEFRAEGTRVSEHQIPRFAREDALVAPSRVLVVRTTDLKHAAPIAPNIVARKFTVPAAAELDCASVSDMTYLPTGESRIFLAVALGLASRLAVGVAMDETMDVTLPLTALHRVLADRCPVTGWIHHSDRGTEYTAGAYRASPHNAGERTSVSRTGDCWDNVVAESLFEILPNLLVAAEAWATRQQARLASFEFIDAWYDRACRHASLEYVDPVQYDHECFAQSTRAA
jgi:putative transposase